MHGHHFAYQHCLWEARTLTQEKTLTQSVSQGLLCAEKPSLTEKMNCINDQMTRNADRRDPDWLQQQEIRSDQVRTRTKTVCLASLFFISLSFSLTASVFCLSASQPVCSFFLLSLHLFTSRVCKRVIWGHRAVHSGHFWVSSQKATCHESHQPKGPLYPNKKTFVM